MRYCLKLPVTQMNADELKVQVGRAALAYVKPHQVLGVGTGSTVNHFIEALAHSAIPVAAAVSSSEQTTARLRECGIEVVSANEVQRICVYIDGADEIDARGCMIKGGGAALTREKIVAALADDFVCIADGSKWVKVLGRFALPVEVIEMATQHTIRRFAQMGAIAVPRPGVLTDNGHPILDVSGLRIEQPEALEREINQWPGVVTVGLFAQRGADVCLLGESSGVRTVRFQR